MWKSTLLKPIGIFFLNIRNTFVLHSHKLFTIKTICLAKVALLKFSKNFVGPKHQRSLFHCVYCFNFKFELRSLKNHRRFIYLTDLFFYYNFHLLSIKRFHERISVIIVNNNNVSIRLFISFVA